MASENGWEPSHAPADLLEWVTVPGTNPPVRLQFMKGWPSTVLRAFAADYHANVEPLRDDDSAAFTPTNSVATSNHLNGTAMDLNWNGPDGKTFRLGISEERAYPGEKARNLRDVLAFYSFEGLQIVFCGGKWSIRDWMHFQMDGNTWKNPKVLGFINSKIRPDGFSTYKRGGTVTPPPPPPASNQVDVLACATGVTTAKAQEILVGVVNGLRDSQCNNVNRIAMWLAQIGHESAGFNATEEYQSGDESTDRWRYKGRTWIQITWQSNYAGLSKWAFGKGLIPTPTYFVDNPKKLAEIQYAGLGPAWYWTVARPQINGLCDARNLTAVTQAINGGQNGAADRKNRYDRASVLGDQLLVLTTDAPPPLPGDDMALVPQDQWDRVFRELTQKLPSRSPLRHLGEGPIDTMAGFILNADGSEYVEIVRLLAGYGHPPTLALLREVASAKGNPNYPDRQDDADMAMAILAEVTTPKAIAAAVVNDNAPQPVAPVQPQIVYVDRPVPAPEPATVVDALPAVNGNGSTGDLIGQAYDTLNALRLADALPIEERAPLAALISVLSTKNGSQIA